MCCVLFALMLVGCDPGSDKATPAPLDTGVPVLDLDHDGSPASEDCDDADAAARPGATEVYYDGRDNDCDAATPDDDLDGDGYGLAEDCDDTDADSSPAAEERWYDGIDQDCDGGADDDQDGDGVPGEAAGGADCDDLDAAVRPDAEEVCGNGVDDDCDGGAGGCRRDADASTEEAEARLLGTDGAWGGALGWLAPGDGGGGRDLVIFAGQSTDLIWILAELPWGETAIEDAGAASLEGDEDHRLNRGVVAGDLDGDGYEDLLVSWPEGGDLTQSGVLWWHEGPFSGAGAFAGGAQGGWQGTHAAEEAGEVLAGGVDLSGDGLPDLVVGSPVWNTGEPASAGRATGRVYLLQDVSAAIDTLDQGEVVLQGAYADNYFGAALAVGDLDGDGVGELCVGVPAAGPEELYATGMVYVYQGPVAGSAADDATAVLFGEGLGDSAGGAVAVADDMDGDGLAELVVGATGADHAGSGSGAVYVVPDAARGPRLLADAARLDGVGESEALGAAIAGGGDADGDGVGDLSVSSTYSDLAARDGGAVWLVHGPVLGAGSVDDAGVLLAGERAGAWTGEVLAMGDADADGLAELAIGAPGWSGAGADGLTAVFAGLGW